MSMRDDNSMIRTQISLDEEAYRAAKAEARRQGVSLAELLRRALRSGLTRRERSAVDALRGCGRLGRP